MMWSTWACELAMVLMVTPMSRASASTSSWSPPGSMQIASPVRRLPITQQFSMNTPTTMPRTMSSFATSMTPF